MFHAKTLVPRRSTHGLYYWTISLLLRISIVLWDHRRNQADWSVAERVDEASKRSILSSFCHSREHYWRLDRVWASPWNETLAKDCSFPAIRCSKTPILNRIGRVVRGSTSHRLLLVGAWSFLCSCQKLLKQSWEQKYEPSRTPRSSIGHKHREYSRNCLT